MTTTVTMKNNGFVSVENAFDGRHVRGEVTIANVEGGDAINKIFGMFYNNGKKTEEKTDVLGLQGYRTPECVIEKLCNYVWYNDIVVVLFNHDVVKWLVDNGFCQEDILFISDNIKAKGAWLIKNGCENVRTFGYDSKNRTIGEELREAIRKMERRGRKITVVSNPPYNDNLDLKLLTEVLPKVNNAYIIHPATYLLNNKERSHFTKFTNKFGNSIRKVTLFNGNGVFGVKLFTAWTITEFDMAKTDNEIAVVDSYINNDEYTAKGVEDITWYGSKYKGLGFKKLLGKVKHYVTGHGSLDSHYIHEYSLTDFSMRAARVRGNMDDNDGIMDDFFTIIANDEKEYNYIGKDYADTAEAKKNFSYKRSNVWSFKSEEERHNFVVYVRSKIARFFLSYYKMNQHTDSGELDIIPWMDFTKTWNDKELKEFWGITDDQWHYIDDFIPDYYDEYSYDAE